MTLKVDFNMRDAQGRVPALVEPDALKALHVGEIVVAEDDEGNRCKAKIEEISSTKPAVYLRLQAGTADPSPKSDWIAEAINY